MKSPSNTAKTTASSKPERVRDTQEGTPRQVTSGQKKLRRASALGIAGAVLYAGAYHEAPWLVWMLCGIVVVACARWKNLWLAAVPIAIFLGDFYPWTGRLWITERDLFLLSICVALLWTDDCWSGLALRRRRLWLGLPYVIMAGWSLIAGISSLPLSAIGDSLSLYTTSGNTVVIGKSLLVGLAFAPFLMRCGRSDQSVKWFRLGMQTSALMVALVVVWERMITVGLFDFSEQLRVSGTFSSMHIGGQHIDAFWAIAIPFVFQFWADKPNRALSTVAIWLLQLLSIFAIFSTMSRALIAYALVSIICLFLLRVALRGTERSGSANGDDRNLRMAAIKSWWRGAVLLLGVILSIGSAAGLWQYGDAVRARFSSSSQDWSTRVEHWSEVLSMVSKSDWRQQWLGHGLGSYPSFFRRAHHLPQHPLQLHAEERTVELAANQRLFLEQWVSSEAELPITVRAKVSLVDSKQLVADRAGHLNVHLCSKILLHSFDCQTGRLDVTGDSNVTSEVQLGATNSRWSGEFYFRRYCPLTLGFSAAGSEGESTIISEISAIDARGVSLIENGDFARGSDRWIFTSDDHLVWRAKNMWLHQLVEMGWLGVIALLVPIMVIVAGLLRSVWLDRDWNAAVVLWAILGFLAMGMFGTLIDVPWILTYMVILLVFVRREA